MDHQDLPGSPTLYLEAAGSPLHYGEEEMELRYILDQELEGTDDGATFQRASITSPLFEVDEEQNYLEDNLNSSILLSEKFDLSIKSQDGNCLDVEGKEEEGERFVEDLSEDELEIEETMGDKFLRKLDRDYVTSPRLIVRGVYKGDVLKLTVRRKTEGTYVDYYMVNSNTNDIILNVKAQMTRVWRDPGTHPSRSFFELTDPSRPEIWKLPGSG